MAKDKSKAKPAEAAEDGAPQEGAGKKKLSKKLLLIGGAAALVVVGGGGAAAFMMMGGGGGEAEAHAPADLSGIQGGGPDGAMIGQVRSGPDGVVFYTLPNMTTNLQSPDGRQVYLKLRLTLELENAAAVAALEPNAPRLQDMFTSFLRELRPEDLEGSQGSFQLRQELQRRVDLVIAPAKVKAVLIEEMLIQ